MAHKAPRLRSDIFAKFRGLNESFFEDIANLAKVSRTQRNALLQGIQPVLAAATEMERRLAQDALVTRMGGDKKLALKAIAIILYLYIQWESSYDTAKGVFSDLRDIGAVKGTGEHAEFMKAVLEMIDRQSPERRRKRTESAAIPDLLGIETMIDFRAVLKHPFSWSTQQAKTYKPEVEGLVAVLVMKLSLSGKSHSVVLQCDMDTLCRLREQLAAAEKEVAAASRYVRKRC